MRPHNKVSLRREYPQGPRSQGESIFRPQTAWVFVRVLLCTVLVAFAAPVRAEVVSFKTRDKVRIAADFIPPAKDGFTVILLHGVGAGRGEWRLFASTLTAKGYGSLAFDARGHGESGGGDYRTFVTTEDWLKIKRDIAAAVSFLESKKIKRTRIVLGGASIGANLMLDAAEDFPEIPFILLLSPGENYQGVRIEKKAKAFLRPAIVAASRSDPYALRAAVKLGEWLPHKKSAFLVPLSGHGAGMFTGKGNEGFGNNVMQKIEEVRRFTASSASPSKTKAFP